MNFKTIQTYNYQGADIFEAHDKQMKNWSAKNPAAKVVTVSAPMLERLPNGNPFLLCSTIAYEEGA